MLSKTRRTGNLHLVGSTSKAEIFQKMGIFRLLRWRLRRQWTRHMKHVSTTTHSIPLSSNKREKNFNGRTSGTTRLITNAFPVFMREISIECNFDVQCHSSPFTPLSPGKFLKKKITRFLPFPPPPPS